MKKPKQLELDLKIKEDFKYVDKIGYIKTLEELIQEKKKDEDKKRLLKEKAQKEEREWQLLRNIQKLNRGIKW